MTRFQRRRRRNAKSMRYGFLLLFIVLYCRHFRFLGDIIESFNLNRICKIKLNEVKSNSETTVSCQHNMHINADKLDTKTTRLINSCVIKCSAPAT